MATTMNPQPGERYITEITLPTGTTYEIVDEGARTLLNTLSNYSEFLGVLASTSTISDGTTTANVVLASGTAVTAQKGNIVIQSVTGTAGMMGREFIYDGTQWQIFGDISTQNLGNLAYKSQATGSVNVIKSVSGTIGTVTSTGYAAAPVITLTPETTTLALTTTSAIESGTTTAGILTYTPAGTVAASLSASTQTYLRAVAGNTLVSSITTANPTATLTGGVKIAEVNTHNLILSWLTYGTSNAIKSSSAANAISAASVKSASFTGTSVYFMPLQVAIPTSATASTASVNVSGTAVTNVTTNSGNVTVTVS